MQKRRRVHVMPEVGDADGMTPILVTEREEVEEIPDRAETRGFEENGPALAYTFEELDWCFGREGGRHELIVTQARVRSTQGIGYPYRLMERRRLGGDFS